MKTSCWWCKAENKPSEVKCSNCGAPVNQNLQYSSSPKQFSNWATLVIEAVVLLVFAAIVFSWIEEAKLSEESKSKSSPVSVVSTPSPYPSPTPKLRSANRRRPVTKKEVNPLLPTEQAPSPDIPLEDGSSTYNHNRRTDPLIQTKPQVETNNNENRK